MSTQLTVKNLFEGENVKKRFTEMLGKRANQFITSVLQIVNSNDQLQKADPMSIYNAAATAATLDLPINNNLGFAYIVPFNQKQSDGTYRVVAQFQLGYKGFIQLAQRSGQFRTIAATPIYEGQLMECNPLTGYKFDFTTRKSDIVIGYAAFFQLLNGFEKTLYMDITELKKHGKKYSQTFKKGFGLWESDFDAMAAKTVLKLLLAKFAPMSIDMQRAVITDQSVINNEEATDVTYVDNYETGVDKVKERVTLMIEAATSVEQLDKIESENNWLEEEQLLAIQLKKEALNEKRK